MSNSLIDNILVTGGAGFIGSTFVAQSVARGKNVIVLDALTYAGHKINLECIKENWHLIEGNIGNYSLVASILRDYRIGHVINFAAESHVDNSIAEPETFIDTNIVGTFRLLQACREYWKELSQTQASEFRYLQVSTDEVYGSLEGEGRFSETSPSRPNSPYAASKAAGDQLTRAWHVTYGLPVIITHCTNNYGPRQFPEKLIPSMIRHALRGDKLPVYGDGKNVRSWIHVEDHCTGVWLGLEKGIPGEVYDFGGQEIENITLVGRICDLLDKKRPLRVGSYANQISFVADRAGHDWRYAIDDNKARGQLGFVPLYTLERGLEETVDWCLGNEEWYKIVMSPHGNRKPQNLRVLK